MAAAALIGPPELQGARREPTEAAAPTKGLTENSSPTFLSSGDPLVDFFFQVVPSTPPATVADLLAAAWKHDAATALKLVAHLRGVRGTGKSDRQSFYAAALWVHKNHPKTLALNAAEFASFGYMKDVLEILHRLVTAGVDTRKRTPPSSSKKFKFRRGGLSTRFGKFNLLQNNKKKKKIEKPKEGTKEERLAVELAKVKIRIEDAAEIRHQKRINMAATAIQRYFSDRDYRFLYDKVVEFFAGLLRDDIDNLKAGEKNKISLAAKWCPSLDSSYDRSTLICEAIARRVFPRDSLPEYAEINERHYAYRVRDRLRKEVLVPLRRALELPEVYIGTGRWSEIPYNRVPSVAMKNYKNLFRMHDGERFSKYLDDVMDGKAKIAAGALLPHQLLDFEEGDKNDQVAELQWRRMVADVAANGKLKNCIAVCDVSGSMFGTPMEVAVALGLLVSELSDAPWKGRVITFSENPQLHYINDGTLREKTAFIKEMDWGMNTDFQKVFDRILELAVQTELPPEKMIKRVFVFSDMEFDTASANSWETDYEAICRKFAGAGYGEAVPEIVFWNLRDSRSTPVVAGQKGVALVSGFSKNLLKMFLENGGVPDPKAVMFDSIAGDEYQKLQVFD